MFEAYQVPGLPANNFVRWAHALGFSLLATALEGLGRKVAVIKCTHHGLDLPGRDTSKLSAPGRPVAALGEDDAAIFWRGKMGFIDLFTRLPADIVLVEGGKNLTFLPRVLCLHDVLEAPMLAPELAVGTFGPVSLPPLPAFDEDSAPRTALSTSMTI